MLVFGQTTRLLSTNDIAGVTYVDHIVFNSGGYVLDAAVGSSIALANGVQVNQSLGSSIRLLLPIQLHGAVPHSFQCSSDPLEIGGALGAATLSDHVQVDGGTLLLTGSDSQPSTFDVYNNANLILNGARTAVTVNVFSGTLRGAGSTGPVSVIGGSSGSHFLAALSPGMFTPGALTIEGGLHHGAGYAANPFVVRLTGPTLGPTTTRWSFTVMSPLRTISASIARLSR